MAEEKPSPWQQAARARWPRAAIVGSGPFAMHASCCENGTVFLFHFAIQAREAANESCGHAFCKMAHSAFQLQPAQQSHQAWQAAGSVGYGE
jgi:hypothetical protein